MAASVAERTNIESLLGADAESLLTHECKGILKEMIYAPGPNYVDEVFSQTDRSPVVMRNLQTIFNTGRLGGTGYVSILPIDQGIEHSAAASFAPNPIYFDPRYIIQLAMDGGCNAVASTLGVLGSVARQYAHRIPFILKINHSELLTLPKIEDQTLFASVRQAFDMGAVAVGATIYFGSPESRRQILEISHAFQLAHELGLATILWAYTRNDAFKHNGVDYHVSADLTGQANYLAVTIEADIVKQKQPENNGGYTAIGFGQHQPPRLQQTHHRPSHRSHPLAGGQLLHGPHRFDQLWRRFGQERFAGRSSHCRHQQARRRYGPYLRAQSFPEAYGRGCTLA